MQRTKISYLDYTYNPTHGCTAIAKGCDNCWARKMSKWLAGMGVSGHDPADPFKVVCDESKLTEPLKLKKPARIGVSFMGDLFHKDVPDRFILWVWGTMAECDRHTFICLTKRPARAAKLLSKWGREDNVFREWPLPNVHLGTSCSTQADLDANLPALLGCPAAVRWLSYEPALEKLDLKPWIGGLREDFDVAAFDMEPHCVRCGEVLESDHECAPGFGPRLDGIVIGCESGPGRRPCKPEWTKSIIDQCDAAGVKVYNKQMEINGKVSTNMAEWPEWAQRQELP